MDFSDLQGTGAPAGKSATSTSTSAGTLNFGGGSLIGADGGLNPTGVLILGVGAMLAFLALIVVAKR